jgi:Carboxypeptidase regulatory-like domain
VVDPSGAVIAGVRVLLTNTLTANNLTANNKDQASSQASNQETRSGENGEFSFTNVAPGPFQLTVTSAGFSSQAVSGILHPGEVDLVPQIVLAVATNVTEVDVGLTREEVAAVAEAQLKIEEKQRVLGAIPNFYVSYIPNAAPLTSKQKFKLAVKTVVDPFTFVVVAGTAGVEQAQNHFIGYGQGAEGFAKRFGAGYADTVSGTFIGGAIFPSLLKQDPRYFYKGVGSVQHRFLYAIANSVICKGDNKRWQPNYSNVLGSLAAGGISNIYYPTQDRNGASLTFVNAAIGLGATAIQNLFQEFLVRRLTPAARKQDAAQP